MLTLDFCIFTINFFNPFPNIFKTFSRLFQDFSRLSKTFQDFSRHFKDFQVFSRLPKVFFSRISKFSRIFFSGKNFETCPVKITSKFHYARILSKHAEFHHARILSKHVDFLKKFAKNKNNKVVLKTAPLRYSRSKMLIVHYSEGASWKVVWCTEHFAEITEPYLVHILLLCILCRNIFRWLFTHHRCISK